MNRNSEDHYTQLPHANIQRAQFKRDFSNVTTLNEGEIVPIYLDEVLPADTIQIKQTALMRMMTPIYPVMDNAYCDFYYFFVPNRILWEHWENLNGANDSSYWAETTEYTTPKDTISTGLTVGSLGDYMGIPTGIASLEVNALPGRAYIKIWNDWFRDENLQQPMALKTTDTGDTDNGDYNGYYANTVLGSQIYECRPARAGKYHDYFTSCLPSPQKGDPIEIQAVSNLGSNIPDALQIYTNADTTYSATNSTSSYNIYMKSNNGKTAQNLALVSQPHSNGSSTSLGAMSSAIALGHEAIVPDNILQPTGNGYNTTWTGTGASMWADSSEIATALNEANASITINELRQAIALQHVLEADARGGTRYTELLQAEFGVTSPDARLQRSEYIGGYRQRVNINQVIQTSSTDTETPQGNTAAYSLTTSQSDNITYSATEHGFIIGLAVVRVDHTYQQGLSRIWTRSDRWSYYNPLLANLGEQAVLNQEIYAQGTDEDEEVFGYQEAWADYRYRTNMITGMMRNGNGLESWTFADHYTSLPYLGSTWIQERNENIAQTLAVTDTSTTHQFLCDFYFDQTWTRPMPIYSIPGLDTI